ncbi:MAG: hypothetical protein ACR2H5_07345 [Ktedonobacteraceae bacterium]
MAQIIKRGILQSFDNTTYTATVLLLEATSTVLSSVPMNTNMDGTSAQVGALCAVLFFDEHNLEDAVILAIYPNGSQGVPTPPPGRVTFVATPYLLVNAVAISSGVTNTYTVWGGSSPVPSGITSILYKAYFTSATVGALVQLAPHSGTLALYHAIGAIEVASATINGSGTLAVDSGGQIDVAAHGGNCTVTLYVLGYVV